ncbi:MULTISPECIES: hypothetical protein [unclassified Exiguobacterium]|uniref:hypothetical protein n=1 Tax=unclassified Exiguobacterium TaxID=2644629 RepID=UPI001BECB4EF|nr:MULTISPECIES: hypothetical protein [unclassified Exiguobacterium]
MDYNSVVFAFAMVAFVLTGRAVYVLMHVLYGVQTLSEYTDHQQELKSEKRKQIQKNTKEVLVHLIIVSAIGFAMFLFATSGSM